MSQVAAAGLLDELCLTLAPVLAGPDLPRLSGGSGTWDAALGLRLTQVLHDAGFLFLRYGRD